MPVSSKEDTQKGAFDIGPAARAPCTIAHTRQITKSSRKFRIIYPHRSVAGGAAHTCGFICRSMRERLEGVPPEFRISLVCGPV